jgi:hypothetical protein
MIARPTNPAMTLSAIETRMFEANTAAKIASPAPMKAAVMRSEAWPVAPPYTNSTIGAATIATTNPTSTLSPKYVAGLRPMPNVRTP